MYRHCYFHHRNSWCGEFCHSPVYLCLPPCRLPLHLHLFSADITPFPSNHPSESLKTDTHSTPTQQLLSIILNKKKGFKVKFQWSKGQHHSLNRPRFIFTSMNDIHSAVCLLQHTPTSSLRGYTSIWFKYILYLYDLNARRGRVPLHVLQLSL